MNANLDAIDSAFTSFSLSTLGGTFVDTSSTVVLHCGTTNGVQLAGAASEKVGFHGQTPTVLPASANQAAIGTLSTVNLTDNTGGSASTTLALLTNLTTLTDSTGGTVSTTLASISDTATKNAIASINAQLVIQAAFNSAVQNALASLAAQEIHSVTDLGSFKTLVNQIRSDLVTKGLLKGSA